MNRRANGSGLLAWFRSGVPHQLEKLNLVAGRRSGLNTVYVLDAREPGDIRVAAGRWEPDGDGGVRRVGRWTFGYVNGSGCWEVYEAGAMIDRGCDGSREPDDGPWWHWGGGWGLDPVLIQPETHMYWPIDAKDPGEIGFENTTGIQLYGADVVRYVSGDRLLFGVNAGVGITAYDSSRVALLSLSVFGQISTFFRVGFGFAFAITDDPGKDASMRDRLACFLGMGIPSRLVNRIAGTKLAGQ